MGANLGFPPSSSQEDIRELRESKEKTAEWVQRYDSAEKRYADFAIANDELKETNRILNPRKPPTAPAEDLSKERQLILMGPGIDVLMIQVALFFAVLSLLSFLVFSRDIAQGLTFLLLCTGVAIGFFLRK
jgi:hypothetical protein